MFRTIPPPKFWQALAVASAQLTVQPHAYAAPTAADPFVDSNPTEAVITGSLTFGPDNDESGYDYYVVGWGNGDCSWGEYARLYDRIDRSSANHWDPQRETYSFELVDSQMVGSYATLNVHKYDSASASLDPACLSIAIDDLIGAPSPPLAHDPLVDTNFATRRITGTLSFRPAEDETDFNYYVVGRGNGDCVWDEYAQLYDRIERSSARHWDASQGAYLIALDDFPIASRHTHLNIHKYSSITGTLDGACLGVAIEDSTPVDEPSELKIGDIVFQYSSNQSYYTYEAYGSGIHHLGIVIDPDNKQFLDASHLRCPESPFGEGPCIRSYAGMTYIGIRVDEFDADRSTHEATLLAWAQNIRWEPYDAYATMEENVRYPLYLGSEGAACSEFVYKVMLEVIGRGIGRLQKSADFFLTPTQISEIEALEYPLANFTHLTPAAMYYYPEEVTLSFVEYSSSMTEEEKTTIEAGWAFPRGELGASPGITNGYQPADAETIHEATGGTLGTLLPEPYRPGDDFFWPVEEPEADDEEPTAGAVE